MANILITSGGTSIPIDPVRSITNTSKGYFGSKLALSALNAGQNVHFFTSRNAKYKPFNIDIDVKQDYDTDEIRDLRRLYESVTGLDMMYKETEYDTYESYVKVLDIIREDKPDIIFLAAAVSDYTVVPSTDKVRSKDGLNLQLTQTEKIISNVKKVCPSAYLVGFKMTVGGDDDSLTWESTHSMRVNGCDAVIANDYNSILNNDHKVILSYKDGNRVASHNYYIKDVGYDHIFKMIYTNYLRKQGKINEG